MRILQGTLSVKAITGKRGVFNVGKLLTDIGEFSVKDKALEQFDAGVYEGEFWVNLIEPQTTRWKGNFFFEIVARIADGGYHINQEGAGTVDPSTQSEPDPIDTEREAKPAMVAPIAQPVQAATLATKQTEPQDESADDLKLFGDLVYPAFSRREIVQLDATIDRELFRLQRDRLKSFGYRFNAMQQSWYLPSEAV